MGGAIALFTREPERHRATGSYEFGNRNTHLASAGYSHLWNNRLAVSGTGRAFTTNGYFLIPTPVRGAVDREANVRFASGDTRFDYLGSRDRFYGKADLIVEDRGNGTPIQRNSTSFGTLSGNYARSWTRDSLSIAGYHQRGEFRSGFSTILNNRNLERVSFLQTVPASAVGGAAYWRHNSSRWNGLAGTDVMRVEGKSIDAFPAITRVGQGRQLQHGRFLQGDVKAGPARFFLGARHHVPSEDRQFFSPSFGLTAGKGGWRGRGSVYRSFRAPTLNELYREFRQGNAVTQANALLKPESIFGAEAGLDWYGEGRRVSITLYRNDIRDIITNVTLRSTPAEIVRQRQNAAQALARGAEAEFRQTWRSWSGEFAYLYVDTKFANGFRTPQIPRHQGSGQVTWQGKRSSLTFGLRSSAAQFEDDINRFLLPGFATAQFTGRQQLWRSLSAQIAFENLLNREYVVGFSPTPLIGAPRLWRAGLRWDGRLF
jgi:outer membrane receptor protein involved in Fe transport